jgi:catechol 2,3-dioxygenase-like lactoylglutathione lyase family enzyme
MLRLKALDHVGIIVTDLERSICFYEALGIELVRRPRRPGGAAVMRLGNAEINMFCNPDAADHGARQRVDHLCLEIDAATIEEVVAALGEARIAVAGGPVPRSDGTALFVHDPDGARIELLVKHER